MNKENTVKKLPAVQIPEQFIDILSKGIDYKTATEDVTIFNIITEMEDAKKTFSKQNTTYVYWKQIREDRHVSSAVNSIKRIK